MSGQQRAYRDSEPDPRDWSRPKRRRYLEDNGFEVYEGVNGFGEIAEYSPYRGVWIEWTSTLDERICLVIDGMSDQERARLSYAWAHKGGCGFEWCGPVPRRYRYSRHADAFPVLDHAGEVIDWWIIETSKDIRPLEERDHLEYLRSLPYDEYLQTKHWQTTRSLALAHYGDTCVLCNGEPVDVHHRTYVRRGQEAITDLVVLCRKCHARFHDL